MSNILPDIKKGDTFRGWSLKFPNDIPLTGYTFLAQFKIASNPKMIFEFKTSDNTITFRDNDPTKSEILFMPRKMDYPPATYVFDIKKYDANGNEETIYKGDKYFSWTILETVTQD